MGKTGEEQGKGGTQHGPGGQDQEDQELAQLGENDQRLAPTGKHGKNQKRQRQECQGGKSDGQAEDQETQKGDSDHGTHVTGGRAVGGVFQTGDKGVVAGEVHGLSIGQNGCHCIPVCRLRKTFGIGGRPGPDDSRGFARQAATG